MAAILLWSATYPYAATYCGGYYGGYGYHYATPYYNSATGAYRVETNCL